MKCGASGIGWAARCGTCGPMGHDPYNKAGARIGTLEVIEVSLSPEELRELVGCVALAMEHNLYGRWQDAIDLRAEAEERRLGMLGRLEQALAARFRGGG